VGKWHPVEVFLVPACRVELSPQYPGALSASVWRQQDILAVGNKKIAEK